MVKKGLGRVEIGNNSAGSEAAKRFVVALSANANEREVHLLRRSHIPSRITDVYHLADVVNRTNQPDGLVEDVYPTKFVVCIACKRMTCRNADVGKLDGCWPPPASGGNTRNEPLVGFKPLP